MKKIFALLYVLPILLTVSCSKSDEINIDKPIITDGKEISYLEALALNEEAGYELSVEEAKIIALDFLNNSLPASKSVSGSDPALTLTNTRYIGNPSTRSDLSKIDIGMIPLFEFDIDGTMSVVVSGDKRFPRILSLANKVDHGEGEVEENVPHLIMSEMAELSALASIYKFEIIKEELREQGLTKLDEVTQTRATAIEDRNMTEYVYHRSKSQARTRTTWGQWAPYNRKYIQACNYSIFTEGRYPTGCAVVCVAQAIAHIEPSMFCYGQQMNWSTLKRQPEITLWSSATLINQVSALMKWVCDEGGAVPSCEGTTMSTSNAARALIPRLGGKIDGESDFNITKVKQSLDAGNPVIMTGRTREDEGHGWIIDEYIITIPGYDYGIMNPKFTYIRCNMGWDGDCDGYYHYDPDFEDFELNCGSNGVLRNRLKILPNLKR